MKKEGEEGGEIRPVLSPIMEARVHYVTTFVWLTETDQTVSKKRVLEKVD